MSKWSEKVEEMVRRKWYAQGLSAVPIFLNPPAYSGFTSWGVVGYGYKAFLLTYKEGYGEIRYLVEDLDRLWDEVRSKLIQNPDFLIDLKRIYDQKFSEFLPFFQQIAESDLDVLSDSEMLGLLKEITAAEVDEVGVSHILEAIGLGAENQFKRMLANELPERDSYNYWYSKLTVPDGLSFIAREEEELRAIGTLSGPERMEALMSHSEKYGWIQNSYAGGKKLSLEFFESKLSELMSSESVARSEGGEHHGDFSPSLELQTLIRQINFSMIWQDERKENVLRTVSHMENVLQSVAKRVGMNRDALVYLGYSDIQRLSRLEDLKLLEDELEKRARGCFFLMLDEGDQVFAEEDYDRFLEIEKGKKTETEVKSISGSIANRGTVIGRVKVCTDIASLDKVDPGDVLVASMTRPEYMPALKKAIAIVTDEGGITCHAAIVSRELGIPAVIGTRVATKVLKDGMLVEVRANHGLVNILEGI